MEGFWSDELYKRGDYCINTINHKGETTVIILTIKGRLL